jgi:hypothetical protein
LTALDFSAIHTIDGVDPADWLRILSHPSLRASLRRLTMHSAVSTGYVSDAMLKLIARLPHLESLSCMPQDYGMNDWGMLAAAPALTELRFADAWGGNRRLSSAPQCPRVTHLHIISPQLYGSAFLSVLSGPSLHQLQSLTLERFFAGGSDGLESPVTSYSAAFASLRHLHSLVLIRVCDVDLMLPHISSAPALRCLTLQPHSDPWFNNRPSAPSPSVLSALLTASPDLHCTILIQADEAKRIRRERLNSGEVMQLTKLQTKFSTCGDLRAFGSRFTLRCDFAAAP